MNPEYAERSNANQGWRWKKMGDAEKKAAADEEMKKMQRLPPNSTYASHRLRVLHKIHHLLSLNLQRTTSQKEELELLFLVFVSEKNILKHSVNTKLHQ